MCGLYLEHRLIVTSAPGNAFGHAEWRDGGLDLRDILDWRRSG